MIKFAKLLIASGAACLVSLPTLAQTPPTTGTITPLPATASITMRRHHAPAKSTAHHQRHKTKSPFLPADARFSDLSQAKAHCPAGGVEWASMGGSALYHTSQSRWFGRTKHGVYACKAVLEADGFRLGK